MTKTFFRGREKAHPKHRKQSGNFLATYIDKKKNKIPPQQF
jgi:hypothetical protein